MKRAIVMILITAILITTLITPVTADATINLDKLKHNLETIITNKAENAKAYLDIATDIIKFAMASFKDRKETDWFAEAVGKLSELDIVNGLPDGSFNPQGEVTRAQFIKMLVQAMDYKKIDSVSFADMKPYPASKPHWASVYIETALRNGVIIKAEEGDRFYPDVPITREDMVMMMCRALKLEPSEGPNPYFDLEEPNGYFTKAYEEYLVRGIPMNGKIIFNPTGVTTRAVSYTHLRAHETVLDLVCRLLLEKKKPQQTTQILSITDLLQSNYPNNRSHRLSRQTTDNNPQQSITTRTQQH